MRFGWLLLLPLLAGAPAPARAALIQLTWSGTIDLAGVPGSGVSFGDPASGSFVVDTETPDALPDDPSIGDYTGGPGPVRDRGLSNIVFSFGSYDGSSDSAVVFRVRDSASIFDPDSFSMSSSVIGPDLGGIPAASFGLLLGDQTRTVFTSDAIPTSLDLGDFADRFAFVSFFDGTNQFILRSSITSLSYTMIPEPGTGLLVIGGLLGLAGWRRVRA